VNTVKTAVIPAAGLGTRLLPATKAVPKELIAILDKPSIMYVLEEALSAGIQKIVLVSGPGKEPLEDFFREDSATIKRLIAENKGPLAEQFLSFRKKFDLHIAIQEKPLGLGHAVLAAKSSVGNEPFLVMLPDELNVRIKSITPPSEHLCSIYNKTGKSCVWVYPVPKENVSQYGIVDLLGKEKSENESLITKGLKINSLIEKPTATEAPSLLALPGRYVFSQSLFSDLEKTKPGRNGEIQLTDAMNAFCKREDLMAVQIQAHRFDVGNKLGLAKTVIDFALNDPEIASAIKKHIEQVLGK
jgi:UTP--glucose-1-phosphate uridylyltransferase